jgi:hypothetical protein
LVSGVNKFWHPGLSLGFVFVKKRKVKDYTTEMYTVIKGEHVYYTASYRRFDGPSFREWHPGGGTFE